MTNLDRLRMARWAFLLIAGGSVLELIWAHFAGVHASALQLVAFTLCAVVVEAIGQELRSLREAVDRVRLGDRDR